MEERCTSMSGRHKENDARETTRAGWGKRNADGPEKGKEEAPAALTVELLGDVSNVRLELLVGGHENGQAVLFGALKLLGRVDPALSRDILRGGL